MNFNRFLKTLFIIIPPILLLIALRTSRIFDEKITNFEYFVTRLSPLYYLTLYFIVFVLSYFMFIKRSMGNSPFMVYYLLMFAFTLFGFPLSLFNYPFQTELYKQAEVFYLLRRNTLSSSDSFGTTIFTTTFTQITGIGTFTSILYVLPVLMYILSALFMYCSIKMLTKESVAQYATLFFISAFFEFFFTNRYAFAEPMYILMILYCLKYYLSEKSSANSLIMVILFSSLTITHIAFSTFTVFLLLCIVSINFIGGMLGKRSQKTYGNILALFITIFLSWNIFQWLDIVTCTYDLAMRLITSIFQGILEINVFGSLTRASPKLEYTMLTYGRAIEGSSALIIPIILLLYQFIKNRRGFSLYVPLSMFYAINLAFIVLGIGWITNSLRPYQLAITFAPFLTALLMESLEKLDTPKARNILFKFLSVQTIVCLAIIVFLLWLPNLTYVGIPSKKIELIKFAASHLPYRAQVYAVGWGEVDEGLFTTVLGDRRDLFTNVHELDSIGSYLLGNFELENMSIPKNAYIYIDFSATRFELKYDLNISSKIDKITSMLANEYDLNLVYNNFRYIIFQQYL